MNFLRHQEQAERTGRRLIWLVLLATAGVVLAVNAGATLAWHALAGWATAPPAGFHLTNTVAVLGLVVGGAWLETSRLAADGALIAHRLGARPCDATADPLQRRLQNVVEELAIAARVGVPRTFVLHDESSINALAAGMDRNASVVVVTRGALEQLTRAELQGVVAHEISHIVNGDVRLNTRLVGMNHGLELVALFGRALLARAWDAVQAAQVHPVALAPAVPLAIAGTLLAVLGAVGELAARAIKAGVGRQREFFADAQAVQFTRDRDGLGSALRKAGGQLRAAARGDRVRSSADPRRAAGTRHPYWENVSHLLLIGPAASRRWFATHPPLRERVHRLYGRYLDVIEPQLGSATASTEPELPALAFTAPADDPAAFGWAPWADGPPADDPAVANPVHAAVRARLVQATREPAAAAALLVALADGGCAEPAAWGDGWAAAASRHPGLAEAVRTLPDATLRALRWPLMELAVGRLRPLSLPSRVSLLATVRARVLADGRLTLGEWVCFSLLRLRLAPASARRWAAGRNAATSAPAVRVLFTLLARAAHVTDTRAERAANAAVRALDLAPVGGHAPLTLASLEAAIAQAARLPPLARPVLLRHLAALLPTDADGEARDLLRLLAVAIDCPLPPLPARRPAGPDRPLPVPLATVTA